MIPNTFFSRVLSQRLSKHLQGFTLVELIVVVTIIAVLSAIGMVSFSGYSSGARDSTRVEDLANMQKSLAIYATTSVNGKYPTPDNGDPIYNNGVLMNTQGYMGKNTLSMIKFNGAWLDPLDNQSYVYSVNKTQTWFALLAFLENASNLTLTSYLEKSFADTTPDYSKRFPAVTWNPIGVFLMSGSLQPVQASTSTWYDIGTNTATAFVAYVAPKVTVTGSGGSTFASSVVVATSPAVASTGSTTIAAYTSSTLYSTGNTFTWSGANITVTGTGMGTSSTTLIGCDTPDIAIWQGGTTNVQIWSACNMGATKAWTGWLAFSSCNGATNCNSSLQYTFGAYYQWGNNADVTSVSTSNTYPNISAYGPGNYYNVATFTIGGADWWQAQNNNLWGNVTNTSVGRQWPCPTGYHVPSGGTNTTASEWGTMYTIVNSTWTWPFGVCNQSNIFTRIECVLQTPPAGFRSWSDGTYVEGSSAGGGYYWSSTPASTTGYCVSLGIGGIGTIPDSYNRSDGFSIRCLRN